MRHIIVSVLFIFFGGGTLKSQVIYAESLKDIDGKTIFLQVFSGKKIVFIILPLSASDSLAAQIKTFAQSSPNVKVIGVLSEEDGYTNQQKNAVKSLYANSGILLIEKMKTRKGSGQAAVMFWLSHKEKNAHFDTEANGIGFKYLLSETGKLYAVLPRAVSLTSTSFLRTINATIK